MYYIYKGDKELKKENLFKAIEYYEKGLSFYPTHTQAWCNLGNIYVLYENFEEAIGKYKEGLKNTNKHFVCRINLGLVLSQKMLDYDTAIDEYEKITTTKIPFYTIPYFMGDKETALINQGTAYYNIGLAYKSKSILSSENDEEYVENLYKSANAYEKAGKYLKTSYDVFYNLGLTHQLLGNNKEAKKAYCTAILNAPLNYEAHYNLAVLLKKEKEYTAALEEFEKVSLILDYHRNERISKYVFELLNEVRKRLATTVNGRNYLKNNFDKNFYKTTQATYVKGKLSVPDEFDNEMLNNFKTCSVSDKINKVHEKKND